MSKAKYKIGDLIRTKETDSEASTIGVIDGILVKKDSIEYILSDEKTHVLETEIEASYAERKPRAPRKVKAEGTTKRTRAAKAA